MTTIAQHFMDFLAAQSLHLLILFAAVLAVTMLLRHKTAHLRYLLWLLIVAKCLIPPLHTIPLAVLPEADAIDEGRLTMDEGEGIDDFRLTMDEGKRIDDFRWTRDEVGDVQRSGLSLPENEHAQAWAANAVGTAQPAEEHAKAPTTNAVTLIAALWLGGATVYILAISVKGVRFERYVRRQRVELTAQSHPAWAGFLAATLPNARPFRLYQLSRPGQPFVWGLWRGAIYLPSNFADVNDPEKQHSILMHEAGHILRFDPLVNLLQVVAQGLFWFHPLVWAANRIIRAEREKCCDEFAVATLKAAPRSYCTAIVDALMAAGPARPAIPTLAVAGPVKNIEDRIKTLLTPGKRFYTRPTIAAILSILLLAIVVVPTTVSLSQRGRKSEVSNNMASHVLASQAAVYMNNGEYERAGTLLKEALDLSPDFAEGWVGYGKTLIKLRDYSKGQKAYEKALELHKRRYNDVPNANELIQQIHLLVLLNKNAEAEQLIQSGNQSYRNDDTFALFSGKDLHQLSKEWQEFRLPADALLTHREKNSIVSEEDTVSHLRNVVFQVIDDMTGQPLQNCEFNLCHFVYFKLKPGAPSPYLDKGAPWYITSFITDIDGIFRLDLADIYATDIVAIETREPHRHIRFSRSSDLAHTESNNHIRVIDLDVETSQVVSNTIYDLKHKVSTKFPIFGQSEEKSFEKIVLVARNPRQNQILDTRTQNGAPRLVSDQKPDVGSQEADGSGRNTGLRTQDTEFPAAARDGIKDTVLLPEYLESHTVLSLKTGQFIPQEQADDSKEPYLYYNYTFPPGASPSRYTVYTIPEKYIGVNAGNMNLGGFEWAPESNALQGLWSIEKKEALPDCPPRAKLTVNGHTTNGMFVSLPLTVPEREKQWPYITAFKGDDGTHGVFEITKVQDRKIFVRFRTIEAVDNSAAEAGNASAAIASVSEHNQESGDNEQNWVIRSAKRWFVTVIVDDQGQLLYNDQPIGFNRLQQMLKQNPTPPKNTVLEVGYTDKAYRKLYVDSVAELTIRDSNFYQAAALVKEMGFESLSFIGRDDPSDRRGPISFRLEDRVNFCLGRDIKIDISDGWDLLDLDWLRFEQRDTTVTGRIQMTVRTRPKTKWEIALKLFDKEDKFIDSVFRYYENSGIFIGLPSVNREELLFEFENLDVEQVGKFEIEVRKYADSAILPPGAKTEVEVQSSVPGPSASGEKKTLEANLKSIFTACQMYQIDNGKWPESIEVLQSSDGYGPYIIPNDTDDFSQLKFTRPYVNYRQITNPARTHFIYDISMLEEHKEIAVVYLDGHIEFLSPENEEFIGYLGNTFFPSAPPELNMNPVQSPNFELQTIN